MGGKDFVVLFFGSSFMMKIVSELVHEVAGHGIPVLLFGGRIAELHVSLLWPYELSFVRFIPPPSGFSPTQLAWVAVGGLLACLAVSAAVQAWLLRCREYGSIAAMLFWLGFWTFLNPARYLVLGGIMPFGDVARLMELGVLGQGSSVLLGVSIFVLCFLSLSVVFGRTLTGAYCSSVSHLRVFLLVFWALVPVATTTSLAGLGHSIPPLLLLLSGIPMLVAWMLPSMLPPHIFGLPVNRKHLT